MKSDSPSARAIPPLEQLSVEEHGCSLLRRVLDQTELDRMAADLSQAIESNSKGQVSYRSQTFGARNLAATWDGWREVTQRKAVSAMLRQYVGPNVGLVRILYFDKPPGHGWSLPWHRDQTIAVQRHVTPLAPFAKPTTKAGVPHVEATPDILQTMLTLRLSLDPMTEDNGPLLFIPGSHSDTNEQADSTPRAIDDENTARPVAELLCQAGDVFAMRPRLLHASKEAAKTARHGRRVVHMEFAPRYTLPKPWAWNLCKTLE